MLYGLLLFLERRCNRPRHDTANRPRALFRPALVWGGALNLRGLWAFVLGVWAVQAGAQTLVLSPPDPDLSAQLQSAAQALALPTTAPPDDLVAAAKGDYGRLLAVLYEAGYFGAHVSIRLAGQEAADVSPFDAPRQLRPITLQVDLGRRFGFGRAEVHPLPPGAALPQAFRSGAVAGTAQIQEAARAAVQAWKQASHAKARISAQDIRVRHGVDQLDVLLQVAPGPALRFGAVRVDGDSAVRAERIRGIAGLPQGQPYRPDAVALSRRRLLDSGAFGAVQIAEAETPNPDGTLDLRITTQDAPSRRIGFGAELSSNDGLGVQGFWMHRNAFGGAERLRFDAEIAGIGATATPDLHLGASLSIPGFRRADDTLDLSFKLARLDEPTFRTNLLELGALRSRRVNDALQIGAGAGFRISDITDAFGSRKFNHAYLMLDAERDGRDDPLNPTRGSYVALVLRPFVGLQKQAGNGAQITADLRGYRAIGARTVVAGRVQIGSLQGADLAQTPPDWLFTSGGSATVRGQAYQSLGVTRPLGRKIGGRGFLGLSGEVRQELGPKISAVGFFDRGYVSARGDFAGGRSHSGAGLGLRYRTPLGPVRIDLGVPIKGGRSGDFELYIGIGQAF